MLARSLARNATYLIRNGLRATYYTRSMIGNRDVVGHGVNGRCNYFDMEMEPYPAIRWKENNQEIHALREKERGDWRLLTCEEKQALYRASFRQSFAEMTTGRPGEWKYYVAAALLLIDVTLLFNLWVDYFGSVQFPPPSDRDLAFGVYRQIVTRDGGHAGLAPLWDYENNKWKEGKCPRAYRHLPIEDLFKAK